MKEIKCYAEEILDELMLDIILRSLKKTGNIKDEQYESEKILQLFKNMLKSMNNRGIKLRPGEFRYKLNRLLEFCDYEPIFD